MYVENMKSPKSGNDVVNQYIIWDGGKMFFQSYSSLIAMENENGKIFLDKYYWNYSRTTSKYRNIFLDENTQETRKKIKSGEYTLIDDLASNYYEY